MDQPTPTPDVTPPVTPLPPEKPLAEARRRLERAEWAKRKGNTVLAVHPDIAVGMAAAGMDAAKISRALGMPHQTVHQHLQHAAGTIGTIRDRLKLQKTLAMERVESRLWPRLERDVDKADAKDIDALSRAAMNLEKIQAQVSGEAQNVNVKQTSDTPHIDLKILINSLLGE